MQEAEVVAPSRVQQVQQAEDTQTASNVNALQQANLLGEDSVAAGAQGNQSNAYLKARAEAAATLRLRDTHRARRALPPCRDRSPAVRSLPCS